MNINLDTTIHDEFHGRAAICDSLCHRKVLLVLDDVDDGSLLKNLAREQNWFSLGSRIIITTRDRHVLVRHGAVNRIYKVEGLKQNEALELFCLNAFKRPKPEEGYMDLSTEVVKYCGGLPLALEVLGSHLCGRPSDVWHRAIEKIKSFPDDKIFNTLKISYDGLGHMERNIFLDIACFFKGRKKDYVTNILNRCGYHAEIDIATLIDKSLLTIINDEYGNIFLGMHDLLEDMGKHIVKQESPNNPSKRSRLWSYKDVDLVLAQNKEIEAIHSISLYGMDWEIEGSWRDLDIRDLSFSNKCQLKLLILDGVEAPILSDIPCTLKVLTWRGCPMKTLPFTDHQRYELVEIDLSHSSIVQLWDGKKFLKKLELLNLSYCKLMKQTPDFSGAPNLKTLHLEECKELNYIHPSLAHHKSLVELNLRECGSLETLANKLEMRSLEKLDLNWCQHLRKLPEFGECMTKLSILSLSYTDIKELPRTLENLVGLSELHFRVWEYIPVSLGCFVGLKKLELSGCSELSCVPYSTHGLESLAVWGWHDRLLGSLSLLPSLSSLQLRGRFLGSKESTPYYDLSHLTSLTDLDLSVNDFLKVPINIHELPRLTRLKLNRCYKLEVMPELPSSLRELNAEDCHLLNASNVNDVISKACCGFAESASQDREDVLQMWIHGKEIPAWFERQEEDNGVAVSFPSTENIALALCFLLDSYAYEVKSSVICNGEKFINKSFLEIAFHTCPQHLFIVCVNGYYLSNLLCQYNCFQMLFPRIDNTALGVQRSGARWVCKQDIQDFKKRKSQTGKTKATL